MLNQPLNQPLSQPPNQPRFAPAAGGERCAGHAPPKLVLPLLLRPEVL